MHKHGLFGRRGVDGAGVLDAGAERAFGQVEQLVFAGIDGDGRDPAGGTATRIASRVMRYTP
jgi:hypothetical protein